MVTDTVLVIPRLEALTRLGKALSDPNRCRILLQLLDGPGYPAALAAALGLSKQGTSNHLACLRDCGLVVTRQEGRRVRYALVDEHLAHALSDLLQVVPAADACARAHA